MRALLVRKVFRLDPGLVAAVKDIAGHLKDETGVKYGIAATVRGLLTIAIVRLNMELTLGKPLAPWFGGARVPRGRRKAGPQPEPEFRVLPW